MKTTAFIVTTALTMLLPSIVSAQQKTTTGFAPVNGLKMYYEIHVALTEATRKQPIGLTSHAFVERHTSRRLHRPRRRFHPAGRLRAHPSGYFDLSPEGKQITMARGNSDSDIVLITNFH